MAEGTEFIIDVGVSPGSISQVEKLAASALKLADQLTGAGTATAAAAQAVKTAEAAYKQAEAGADRAAKAVEKLGLKADEQRAKLEKLGAGKDGVVDIAAYRRAQTALENLTQRQTEAAAKADAAKSALAAQAASVDQLRVAAEAAKATETGLVKAHAEAAAAAKAAAAAETAAAKERESAAEKLAKAKIAADQFAVKEAAAAAKAQEDAAKKAADAQRLATAGTGKVNELAEAFGTLGGPVGGLGNKLFGAANGFQKFKGAMGAAGPYVAVAVGIAAIVAGVAGVAGATAAAIGSVLKWSITLADKNSDIEKQTTRLRGNIDKIFSGLKIGGIVDGLSKIGDLFAENSASANAIKVVFESMFQPIVDGIASFIPMAISAFLQFEILVLKALIAIKPFGSTIMTVAKLLGVVALVVGAVLAAAIAVVVVNIGLMIAAFAAVLAVVGLVIKTIWNLTEPLRDLAVAVFNAAVPAFNALVETVKGAIDWLSSLSLAEIGSQLIQGLINGITGAGGGVLSAITNVATGAINAAKNALGIASPSKVFAEIGGYTAEGMAVGVDEGAPSVQGSMEEMVAPPASAPSAGPAAGSSSGGIHIENLVIQSKTDDPQAFADAFRTLLDDMLAQSGRAVPA